MWNIFKKKLSLVFRAKKDKLQFTNYKISNLTIKFIQQIIYFHYILNRRYRNGNNNMPFES